ncbi:MAG: SGNH/GDSL hydrolase family protein [Verrucomicrobiales bacterium]
MIPPPVRSFLFGCLTIAVSQSAPWAGAADDGDAEFEWHSVVDWVEGRGWPTDILESPYDRLPAKARGFVRDPVWNLSRHSAGMLFRFNANATEFKIRYTVGSENLSKVNVTAIGASGVDLYALASDGQWKWVDVTRPKGLETVHTVSGLDPGMRAYMAYLPLFNSVEEISVGFPKDTEFQPVAPREKKPIVFYGTSITHGASASRPGMTHVALLGRRLDKPVVNLGFSGNGRMEPEVGALLSEIDASLYVIDCLPNMQGDQVAERTEPLVQQLRRARPDIPIVLVEDRSFSNAWLFKAHRTRHRDNRTALAKAYDNLVSSGITDLYYLEGDSLLGEDTEATTDGSHPSDLGFMRQADAFEPVLREALGMQ